MTVLDCLQCLLAWSAIASAQYHPFSLGKPVKTNAQAARGRIWPIPPAPGGRAPVRISPPLLGPLLSVVSPYPLPIHTVDVLCLASGFFIGVIHKLVAGWWQCFGEPATRKRRAVAGI